MFDLVGQVFDLAQSVKFKEVFLADRGRIIRDDQVKEILADDFVSCIAECVDPCLADGKDMSVAVHGVNHGRGFGVEVA